MPKDGSLIGRGEILCLRRRFYESGEGRRDADVVRGVRKPCSQAQTKAEVKLRMCTPNRFILMP